jgi:hypothetical protein
MAAAPQHSSLEELQYELQEKTSTEINDITYVMALGRSYNAAGERRQTVSFHKVARAVTSFLALAYSMHHIDTSPRKTTG